MGSDFWVVPALHSRNHDPSQRFSFLKGIKQLIADTTLNGIDGPKQLETDRGSWWSITAEPRKTDANCCHRRAIQFILYLTSIWAATFSKLDWSTRHNKFAKFIQEEENQFLDITNSFARITKE